MLVSGIIILIIDFLMRKIHDAGWLEGKLDTAFRQGNTLLSTTSTRTLPNPLSSGQLYVGPGEQGIPASDCDFLARGGSLAYLHMFIEDPYALSQEEDDIEPRPTEDIDAFITVSINGAPFIERMPLHPMPANTNIDLAEALASIKPLQPLDIISINLDGGENMYRSVLVGYGVM